MIKKSLSFMLVLMMVFFALPALSVYASSEQNDIEFSFDEFIEFLRIEASIETLDESSAEFSAMNTLNLALNLPVEMRDEFIKRLYNPESWDLTFGESGFTSGVYLPNGSRQEISSCVNRSNQLMWREFWSNYDVSILGISVLRLRQELNYDYYPGNKVTKINKYTAFVQHNWVPFSIIGTPVVTSYIQNNGTRAYGEFHASYKVGPFQGLSIQVTTWRGYLWGGVNGSNDYSWKWWQ